MTSKRSEYRNKQKQRLQNRLTDDPSLMIQLTSKSNTLIHNESNKLSTEQNFISFQTQAHSSVQHVEKDFRKFQIDSSSPSPSSIEMDNEFKIGNRPTELNLDLGLLASKHHLPDSCMADILKILRKNKVSDDIIPANVRRWKNNMLISDFSTTTYWECKLCHTLHTSSSCGLNFECCGQNSTQNDDHYIVFKIQELLQYTLPQLFDHISLEDECSWDRNLRKIHNLTNDDIIITLNTDGAPLFSSSNSSIWPVLAYINGTSERRKKDNILLPALWIGKKGGKPEFNTFLSPILDELSSLSNSPLKWKTLDGKIKLSRVFASKVLCDSIARPLVMKMVQFNGRFGCCFCMHEDSGHYFKYTEKLADSRTHQGLVELCEKLKNDPKMKILEGIKGLSPFSKLEYFDLIKGFPMDILHFLDLGITKHFTGHWINSANHKSSFYIPDKIVQKIDKDLESIQPPARVSRLPRGLKYLKFFKGHELNMWCLYYSPIILRNVLPKEYYDHWVHLVYSISLLVKQNVNDDDIDVANKNIDDFASQIEDLYGPTSERFNIHLLRHLPEFVQLFGSPQKNSMCCFENFNAVLSNHVNSSQFVVSQISSRYLRDVVLHHFEPRIYSVSNVTGHVFGEYKLMNSMQSYGCTQSEYAEMEKGKHATDDMIFYQYLFSKGRRIHSKSYPKFKRRNNCCVITDSGSAFEVSVFFFNKKFQAVFAIGNEHKLAHALNLDHIFVSCSSSVKILNVGNLGEILLKVDHEGDIFFCTFLNDYSHYNE